MSKDKGAWDSLVSWILWMIFFGIIYELIVLIAKGIHSAWVMICKACNFESAVEFDERCMAGLKQNSHKIQIVLLLLFALNAVLLIVLRADRPTVGIFLLSLAIESVILIVGVAIGAMCRAIKSRADEYDIRHGRAVDMPRGKVKTQIKVDYPKYDDYNSEYSLELPDTKEKVIVPIDFIRECGWSPDSPNFNKVAGQIALKYKLEREKLG